MADVHRVGDGSDALSVVSAHLPAVIPVLQVDSAEPIIAQVNLSATDAFVSRAVYKPADSDPKVISTPASGTGCHESPAQLLSRLQGRDDYGSDPPASRQKVS